MPSRVGVWIVALVAMAGGLAGAEQKTRPLDPATPAGGQAPAPNPVPGGRLGATSVTRGVPADGISIAINYTGKGQVNAEHQILLFLFSDPEITADSRPIATMALPKNGVTATFRGVIASPVFVAAAYDQAGKDQAATMPLPDGTPFATFAKDAKSPPAPVKPGQPVIKMNFGDARRWAR